MSLEQDITEIKKLVEAGGLFKPRTPEQVRVGHEELYGDLKKNTAKKVAKLKDVVFPKIVAGLQANGKVDNVEMSDSLGASEYGDQTIRATLSCLFRGNELNISVNAAEENYTTFNVEFDGDDGFKQFRSGTVAGTVLNIVKASRAGETQRGMATLKDKSKSTTGGNLHTRHSVWDVGSMFMKGETTGRVIHNGNVQASIVGDVLYAYATPIAIRKDGVVYAVDKKFSNTTTRLQDSLHGATRVSVDDFKVMLQAAGITDLGYLGEAGLFKPASPEQVRNRPLSNVCDWCEAEIPEGTGRVCAKCHNHVCSYHCADTGDLCAECDYDSKLTPDSKVYSVFYGNNSVEGPVKHLDYAMQLSKEFTDRGERNVSIRAYPAMMTGWGVMSKKEGVQVFPEPVAEAGLFKPATPQQRAERDTTSQYKTINDAPLVGPPGGTEIWYYKDTPQRQYYGMGYKYCSHNGALPDPEDLQRTHVLLGTTAITKLGHVYNILQGDEWSPEGEARNLIRSKGLDHTSMSMGDIIKIGDKVWFTDSQGWVDLVTGEGDDYKNAYNAYKSTKDPDEIEESGGLFKPATPEQIAARPKAEPYLITVTLDPKYGRLITVGGFNLSIGNNYTDNHFIRFLVTQHPDLINELYRTIADNDDTIKFIYRGSYGNHEDTFSVYDFFQMVKGVEGQLDALQNGVEDINGMNEAGLFKPATPEQIASRPQPKPRYFEFTATYYMISIRSSVRGFTDDISGSIGGGNLDLYDVETEVAGRNAYEEEDETYTHFSTSGKFKVRAPGDYPHNAEYTIDELTDWVIETLAEAIESLGGHYPQNLDVRVVGVTEAKGLFKPATPEQVAARKPHYKGGYKFLEFIDDPDPEENHWALSGGGGHFHFVDERNSSIYFHKNEDPEFQISIDTEAVTEEYLELDQDLTKECQEDFGKYDTGGWGSWIEKWLVAKGWTVLDSGNTCNWDPSYYWGGIFEYTTFEDTDGREGVVMMKHLGGDYRGNYVYPKVYFGDWGEFISAQNPGDPQEEIGYLFGYDGDYQALVNDIKKYRAQPKEGEEVEMSSEEPAPTHQASPGQMNWAMQGDNPAETHYESKRGR